MPNVTIYVMTTWQNLPNKSTAVDATNLNHIEQGIKAVTDFINTLNVDSGKYLCQVAFTTAMKNKLDGIEAQANKYVLPTASNNTLGGVKVDGTTIVIDANGVIRSNGGNLSTLLDVNFDDLEDGQIIKWDETEEKWVNTSEADVKTKISELTDVQLTDLANGEILKWDETAEKWVNAQNGEVLSYDETLDVLGLPPNPIYRYRELIPIMTSNTTPSGVASASAASSGYEAYKAMIRSDSGNNDRWGTAAGVSDAYIQYKFPEAVIVEKFEYKSRAASRKTLDGAVDFQIIFKGSNDGTNWTDLGTYESLAVNADDLQQKMVNNTTAYEYYRLQFVGYNITNGANHYCGLTLLQMYEKYLA